MQQSLFGSQYDNTPMQLDMPDADVCYYPNFIQSELGWEIQQRLEANLRWRQEQITVYGKTYDQPRLDAWYGDKNAQYRYSNRTLQPLTWDPDLLSLKEQSEGLAKARFNSVLANLYRNGQDGMGRHADNEPELGVEPVIASLSFGESRHLDFYHNHCAAKVRLALEHGSLLVMKGATQSHWQHGIAKSKKILASRISLTFRLIHTN
jgi:alkylated DNA repair dioxygenase AlkB